MKLEERINQNYAYLNSNDLAIISYLLNNKKYVSSLSIQKLSLACHVSNSSIVRLTQKLGFSGYSEFKYFLKNENKRVSLTYESNLNLLTQDINETIKLISQTDLEPTIQALKYAKRIFGYGTGWGEKNAINELTRNFMSCGIFIIPLPSITELNWNIDSMTSDDLIIFISYSGENKEAEQNITALNLRGIPFISVTPLKKNYLASMASFNLYYQVTPLLIDHDKNKEYNLFITLNIVVDALFRAYLDYY